MEIPLSFDVAEKVFQNDNPYCNMTKQLRSFDAQANSDRTNEHVKTPGAVFISNIEKGNTRPEEMGIVTVREESSKGHWQLLKQNLNKAVAGFNNISRASTELLINVKAKYESSFCQDEYSSSNNSAGNGLKQWTKAKSKGKRFPFCDEYDGRAVRRTKTISESIQAILEERRKVEKLSLRQEVEKQVFKMLPEYMYRYSEKGESRLEAFCVEDWPEMQRYDLSDGTVFQKYSINEKSNNKYPIDLYEISDSQADISATTGFNAYLNIIMGQTESKGKLKITVLSIENLFALTETSTSACILIKACVMPRNGLKQKKTRTMKSNDTVVFDEDFLLNGISQGETQAVRFRVYLKANRFLHRINRCIGESFIWLDDIDLQERSILNVQVNSYL